MAPGFIAAMIAFRASRMQRYIFSWSAGELPRHRPGTGDVRFVVLEVGSVVHVDHLARLHLPPVVLVVDDGQRPRRHDREEGRPGRPIRVFTYCAAAAISYSYIPGRVPLIASATASAPIRPLRLSRSISNGDLTHRSSSSMGLTSARARCGATAWTRPIACDTSDGWPKSGWSMACASKMRASARA